MKVLILVDIGNLRIFKNLDSTETATIFWQDKATELSYGPFITVHDAMSNFEYTIRADKKAKILADMPLPDNIIHVDFVLKKRL